jgi:hypothetical protein
MGKGCKTLLTGDLSVLGGPPVAVLVTYDAPSAHWVGGLRSWLFCALLDTEHTYLCILGLELSVVRRSEHD